MSENFHGQKNGHQMFHLPSDLLAARQGIKGLWYGDGYAQSCPTLGS